MGDIIQRIRWIPYRIRHGFWPDELYDLDFSIVKFVLPRLREFRYTSMSYPAGITYNEWTGILDEIIWAFENYKDTDGRDDLDRMEEGVRLFGEYFFQLWN